jgi:hypothetical protein
MAAKGQVIVARKGEAPGRVRLRPNRGFQRNLAYDAIPYGLVGRPPDRGIHGDHDKKQDDAGSPGSDGASPYLPNRARSRARSRNRSPIAADETRPKKMTHNEPANPPTPQHADPPIRSPPLPLPYRSVSTRIWTMKTRRIITNG